MEISTLNMRLFILLKVLIKYSLLFLYSPLGEDCSMWLEPTTKAEYMDTKFKKYDEFIKMDIIKPELLRKQKKDEVQKYPYTIWYEISPCKYDTIEFIKDMTELLS